MTTRPDAAPELDALVVRALIGAELPELSTPGSAQTVAESLIESGWSPERLLAHRDAEVAAGRVWPRPIPASERGEIGAAQLDAAIKQVLVELGATPTARVRDRSVPLSTHDRQLMADRPPHHGTVG